MEGPFLEKELARALSEGDVPRVEELVSAALEEGKDADELLRRTLMPVMDRIGIRFETKELYFPELVVAAEAMKAAMKLLHPHLKEMKVVSSGKVILGTVWKDLHDIGKNLVRTILEGAGFEVVDLGTNVLPEQFVAAVREHPDARVLGLSALLTTTMKYMKNTIGALDEEGLRDRIRIIVGGAPVTEAFASEVGADAYAPDANAAKLRIRQLCEPGGP